MKSRLSTEPYRGLPAPVLVDAGANDLDAQLVRLETAQLVRRALDDEAAYLFKHVPTQEASQQNPGPSPRAAELSGPRDRVCHPQLVTAMVNAK